VVLVGFMAAGKTTIGRRLAELLGWRFVDFDPEIEARTGLPIPEIFRRRGEARFRALEVELTAELAAETNVVLAPGGGWMAQPGLLDLVRSGSIVIWLRVTSEEAVRRAVQDDVVRPLLEGEADPVAAARRLLASREARYARADWVLDVDGRDPDDVVGELAERLVEAGVVPRHGDV